MENLNKCMHDDCFTCPYPDCISNTEPVKHKPGRKKLSPEEKASRKREQHHQWYERNRARILEENKEKYYRRKSEKKENKG